MCKQNNIERVKDLLDRGTITAAQANVQMVRDERFRLITGWLNKDVHKALNMAVRSGELKHLKKEGLKPEAYYHPTFEYLAKAARNKRERESLAAISGVVA